MKPKKISESLRASLWFADPDTLDWQSQKDMIITAVLNRGTWEAVRWIYHYYGEEEIREVLRHPKRGLWFPQALKFWLTFFNLPLDTRSFQKALFKI